MKTYFTIKRVLLVLSLLAISALAGCQTTAGFGRDVASTGRWIEGGAHDAQQWMFGSSAQAAEAITPAKAPEQAITPAAAGENVVYFKTGSADISPDGLKMIRAIADDSKQGTHRIEVAGYTDAAGPSEYNKELSKRRAVAVADELAAQGVRRESIDLRWYGKDQLPVPTADGVHNPENRRVSIAMTTG